jgi:hypothetical protein
MNLSYFMANYGSTLLFASILVVFMVVAIRSTQPLMSRRAEDSRRMRELFENQVLPEFRALRQSVDAIRDELKSRNEKQGQ